jgi:CubicO group peptidase (beta-lactamase class C family)
MRALAALLVSVALPAVAEDTLLPELAVRTLQGTELKLPADLPAAPQLLVIGFTGDAREQTESWTRQATATFGRAGKVSIFEVAVLDAPRLLHPLLVEGIRRGIPKPLRERFAVATQQVDQWKAVAGFDDPDTAYVLLLDAQHRVIWRRTGPWSDEADQALLRELARERRRAALQSRPPVNRARIDAMAELLMQRESVNGLALAVIDGGEVLHVTAYGHRNVERDLPLTTESVMYGASLTKTAFTYMLLQLVDDGKLDLDTPIAELLPEPLPAYEDYADLAADERWRALTPRILISHTSGLANFRGLEEDGRLRLHHAPGSRYGYSGEGFRILQLALEEGLGLDVGAEMQRRIFDRFGMTHTSMQWREDFAGNLADGYTLDGSMQPHARRSRASAAGSMDTTISDQARMWAGIVRGDGLSAESRAELVRPQISIESRHQFPTLSSETDLRNRRIGLAAGLGLVVFRDASGPAWFKGGHDDGTGNFVVCLENGQRCVVLLANDVRAERIYPELVGAVLGDTRMPWRWEYDWAEDPGASP